MKQKLSFIKFRKTRLGLNWYTVTRILGGYPWVHVDMTQGRTVLITEPDEGVVKYVPTHVWYDQRSPAQPLFGNGCKLDVLMMIDIQDPLVLHYLSQVQCSSAGDMMKYWLIGRFLGWPKPFTCVSLVDLMLHLSGGVTPNMNDLLVSPAELWREMYDRNYARWKGPCWQNNAG